MSPLLTTVELEAIQRQARVEYPVECCGVLLVRPGAGEDRQLLACRNIQDELHARDPERHPRTARTAYYIAHADLLEIGRREGQGFEVRVIYHSHVDAGAYFSETDRRNAMMDGSPTYPQATYVVVAVAEGRVTETRAHRFDSEIQEFVEVSLSASEGSARAERR